MSGSTKTYEYLVLLSPENTILTLLAEHHILLRHLLRPLAPRVRKPLPRLPHRRHPDRLRQRTRRRSLHPRTNHNYNQTPRNHQRPQPPNPRPHARTTPPPHQQIRKLEKPKSQPGRQLENLQPPHHRLRLLPRLAPPRRRLRRRQSPPNKLPQRTTHRPLPFLLWRLHLRLLLPGRQIRAHGWSRRPRQHMEPRRAPHRCPLSGSPELGLGRRFRPLAVR